MELQSIKNRSPASYAALLLITLMPLYYASYRYRLVYPYGGQPAVQPKYHASAEFVRDWLSTPLISPFNPSAIATYCNRTEWHPNLVFNLDNANGGIGNVRGNILDFIFFAIEAGASIILPGRAARSQEDISNVWAARAPFDSFFDEEWFRHTMAQACPEMAIYKPEAHHELVDALPGNYIPRSRRADIDASNTKAAYLEHLSAWMKEKPEFQPEQLTLINLERTLWDVDTRSLPQGFRRNFGQILRTNATIARLAAVAVETLASQYDLNLNPQDEIPRHAFYGAHLRTEADAASAGWLDEPHSNFSMQTDAYITQALKHDLHIIYVASGNTTDLDLFKTKASSHRPPLKVTSKHDLLPATALENLSWDQQALVDYEVLQRSSVFGGVVKSSFSYNIAMTRNQRVVDSARVREPWRVLHEEVGVAFDDGVSRVLGRDEWHEGRIPRGMWP